MGNGEINFSLGDTGNTKQKVMPLRILIVGDFCGESEKNSDANRNPVGSNKPYPTPQSIDKYSLDTYLSSLNINLHLETDQFFTPASGKRFVQYSPRSLNDFTPKGMIETIPDLKRLHALKTQIGNFPPGALSQEQLTGLKRTYSDIAPLQAVFALFSDTTQASGSAPSSPVKTPPAASAANTLAKDTATQSTPNPEDNAISRLLDMVGTSDQPTATHEDAHISNFVSAISHSSQKPKQDMALRKTAQQYIDTILQTQLNALLHNKTFQSIESLWRGFKFLVDRTNFREAIEIQCLSTPRDDLVTNLKHGVTEAECNAGNAAPYTVILSTFYVANTASEITELQTITEYAETLQTPVIVALTNAFLGNAFSDSHNRTNTIANLNVNPITWMNQPQYQQWNAMRHKPCARWGVALFNRFMLRDEYDPEMRQSAGITENSTSIDDALWGHPGFALLALITRSFEKTGWPTEIQGRMNGELDDLCLRHVSPASDPAFSTPLETLLTIEQIQDLSATGITSLSGSINDDRAYIYHTPCLWQSAKYSEERYTAISDTMNNLAYQLLITRLARAVSHQMMRFRQIDNESVLTEEITHLIRELLATTGDGASATVTVENNDDDTQQRVVLIQARTGKKVLNGADVEFGLAI